MSTIASPRASTSASIRSPTSSRTSLDISSSTNPAGPRALNPRRNRAALRDYYGLKSAAAAAAAGADSGTGSEGDELAEIDRQGFDADKYVNGVLQKEGLEGVLKVEAGLVGEIRGLDGERKALVYDNYSKLIAATDTIKKMRTNMDPLAPATSTLSPAISHIAETAAALSTSLTGHILVRSLPVQEQPNQKERQRQTVRWVLDAPIRFQDMLANGRADEVDMQWKEVSALLHKWKGADGVEQVRAKCEKVMEQSGE